MRRVWSLTLVTFLVFGCGENSSTPAGGGFATGGLTGGGTGGLTGAGTGGLTGAGTGGMTGAGTGGMQADVWQGGQDTNQAPTICQAGETFCQNNILFTCDPLGKSWIQTTCDLGCIMVGNQQKCKGNCPAGYMECQDAKNLKICDANGFYTIKVCQGQCMNNQCTEDQPLCVPNQKFCAADGFNIMLCSADGKSAAPQSKCQYGCEPQSVTCKQPACNPGQKQCSAQQPLYIEACKPDQSGWQLAASPCKFQCANGECVDPQCSPGQKKCGGEGIIQCNNDQSGFSLITPCPNGCVVDGSGNPMCSLCTPGTVQCGSEAEGKQYTVQQCQSAATGWIDLKTCPFPEACSEGKCINAVILEASKTADENKLLLGMAMSNCWKTKNPGVCTGINTTAISYSIGEKDLEDWFCPHFNKIKDGEATAEDNAFKAQFPNNTDWENINNILGCDGGFLGLGNPNDLTIEQGVILPGKDAHQCMGFDPSGIFTDELIIDICGNF